MPVPGRFVELRCSPCSSVPGSAVALLRWQQAQSCPTVLWGGGLMAPAVRRAWMTTSPGLLIAQVKGTSFPITVLSRKQVLYRISSLFGRGKNEGSFEYFACMHRAVAGCRAAEFNGSSSLRVPCSGAVPGAVPAPHLNSHLHLRMDLLGSPASSSVTCSHNPLFNCFLPSFLFLYPFLLPPCPFSFYSVQWLYSSLILHVFS